MRPPRVIGRREREGILWAIYILFVIAVLLWVALTAAYGAPVKRHRPIPEDQTTAGRGALDLICPTVKPAVPIPKLSTARLMALPSRMYTNTLAWDYADLSTVTNFQVYRGFTPGVYTASNLTGLVLSSPFIWISGTTNWAVVTAIGTNGLESEYSNEIRVPPIYTNFVVRITTVNATNLQWATALGRAWTLLGATNYTATNPPPSMWRAVGKVGPSLFIKSRWE